MTVAVANAPVSYGSFELTVGIVPGTPDGSTVLARVAEASHQTGHLLLGGDPLRCLHNWIGHINHLHVKSARLDVMRARGF